MALRSLDLGRALIHWIACGVGLPVRQQKTDTLMGRTPAPGRYSHFASYSGSVLRRLEPALADPFASLLHLMDNYKLLSGDDHNIEHIANHTHT